MKVKRGRHFLQIPGPTNVPDRVLRAIAQPTIDHRGPAAAAMAHEIFDGLRRVFRTAGDVVIYASSGRGALEAALVNTLSPGDRVLMYETGQFATIWRDIATKLGLNVEFLPGDWRHGVDAAAVQAALGADRQGTIKAVAIMHNETSSGATSSVADVRRAIDAADHPALLLVDTVSSLACMDYRHDEWGVDVSVGASQKGLMLPPGLAFQAISPKALAAAAHARLPRAYWDWGPMRQEAAAGFFPFTPATNLLFGLREALHMLAEEGLPNVFARHARHAEAARRAVAAWGLDLWAAVPRERSASVTAVAMPAGHDGDAFRRTLLDRFDLSLGGGLGKLKGRIFRIGHLGDFNDLMLAGTLGGIEMGLAAAGVPFKAGGVTAALEFLSGAAVEAGHGG